ncbi:MAG: O-antigen ligase family protein [Candidatus Omnitrophica bacterium]|nr:O-antigen ligase family protein [Candidatus Omnitrophota bacterium]
MGRALLILGALLLAAVIGFILSMTKWQIATNVLLGVVALVLTMVSLEIGLGLTIFLVPLTVQQQLGQLAAAPVRLGSDDFLMGCMLMGALVNMARSKRVFWVRSPLNAPLMAFFAACLISLSYIIAHRGFGPAFRLSFLHLLKWFEPVTLYFLVVASVTRREQILRYIVAGLSGCVAVAALQMAQHRIGPASSEEWYQLPSGQLYYRAASSFGTEGILGAYYVLFLGIILALVLAVTHRRARVLLALFAGVVAVMLLITYNRASYLGAAVMLVVLGVLSKRRATVVAIMIGAVVLGACVPTVMERFTMTIQSANLQSHSVQFEDSAAARLGLWMRALKLFVQNPVTGVGFWGQRSMGLYGATAHSQYLTLLVDTGALGLMAFVWIFWTIFHHANRVRHAVTDPWLHALTIGVMAGLSGVLVHAVFGESFDAFRLTSPLWFFTGLVMAILRMTPEAAPDAPPATTSSAAPPSGPASGWRPRLVPR